MSSEFASTYLFLEQNRRSFVTGKPIDEESRWTSRCLQFVVDFAKENLNENFPGDELVGFKVWLDLSNG